jgi:cation:H+ antiporter
VGLSLVAVGTSLPELIVARAAARRGNGELIVGNVMGSNIANVLLILGLTGLVRPLAVPEQSVVYSIPICLFFSLALLHFIRSDWQISRRQGAGVVAAYGAFLLAAFLQRWG